MRRVIIESPFGRNPDGSVADVATVERNIRYVRACIADSLRRGEAPFASHALYTLPGVLDDRKPEERKLGMAAGVAWYVGADDAVAYLDFGITEGMEKGLQHARALGKLVLERRLGGAWGELARQGAKR